MTIEMLKQNVEREKQIAGELVSLYNNYVQIYNNTGMKGRDKEMKLVEQSIIALFQQLRILNKVIPNLVDGVSFYRTISEEKAKPEKPKEVLNVKYIDETTKKPTIVAIKKKDEMSFLKSLALHKFSLKKLWQKPEEDSEKQKTISPAMKSYVELSNKLFRNSANKLVEKQYFNNMRSDLRKIASPFIINSYISISLFSVFLSFFFGLFIAIFLVVLGISIPTALLALIIAPIGAGILLYSYPSSSRKGLEKQINQELPFLVIYMSAISTSGIEPSKLFDILVKSKDYPYTRREIKKLTNYVNFYGYDLVTALKAVAKNCPSERLAQLFDGFSTTITSGGALTEFLNKHSDTLLFDYRLEREKYTHTAETFMNIYISVVIAAPMIMMMLFILMKLTGFGAAGISTSTIGILAVLVISMLNVGFLVFLNSKQPKF